MSITNPEQASVRYLVHDVNQAIDFYTSHLGFTIGINASPAFAEALRGPLRLLLSGPTSSGDVRYPMGPCRRPADGIASI